MQNYAAKFKGQKITVLGLGLLGRGVGDVEFLAKCGAQVLVTDKKTAEQLAESVERLKQYKNVAFRLGEHRIEDFISCDMVIKVAGVSLDSPEIVAARKADVPVVMSTALFAKYAAEAGAIIVGVTGTRGKSTVAHMINHVLIRANKSTVLGGNIRGVSTIAMLPDVGAGDVAVLELDSWQLQGFGDLRISPHISVFTNLMPDHQNYYPDMDAYFLDKANIFRFQKDGDSLFAGASVAGKVRAARPPIEAVVPPAIPSNWTLKIPGEHNRENAALAAAALNALGLSEREILSGLESFEGVEGRLQFVKEIKGVRVYNDNSATTPEATIAALRAVGNRNKNVVLIVGGDDKRLNMSELVAEIPKWCRAVVLFKERGTDRIRDSIFALKNQGTIVYEEEGLKPTVKRAFSIAESGEVLLFSPAFSSFGKYFKNEFDRGDQFLKIVNCIS